MRLLAATCLAAVVAAGCGSNGTEVSTPSACLGTSQDYLAALDSAPGEVRLEGTVPISDCVVPQQQPGALATVGEATTGAAAELGAEARRNPRGDAAVELGYLIGAVEEGASSTGGVHADLVRRLGTERFAGDGKSPGAEFEQAFGEGYAAGRATG